MRRLFWGIIVTIILCFCQCTPVIQAEPDKIKDIPLQTDAMTDMLSGFAAYSSFLGECRCEGIYRIPLHGSSKVQAFAYLTQFFEPALAEAVIEECTRWEESVQSLVITPADGIPVLTNDDRDKIRILTQDANTVVFAREYNDCYQWGDCYLFRITMHKSGQGWKISTLEFEAQKNERMQRNETL